MSTNPQPNARIVGAPPIPTSNPAGDVVVSRRPRAAGAEKHDIATTLLGRLRAAIGRMRTHA